MTSPLPKPTSPQQPPTPPAPSGSVPSGQPQKVQLGGKTIPVPANQPVSVTPPAKPPAGQLPTRPPSGAPAPLAGVNPALAPKPATAPIQSGQTPAGLPAKPAAAQLRPPADSKGGAVPPGKTPTTPSPILAATPAQSFLAQIKEDPKRWLLILLVGVIALFSLIWFISRLFTRATPAGQNVAVPAGQEVTLTYWGLWEPTEAFQQVISEYEEAHPGTRIDYRVQSHRDYRERLQTAIASGNGPDIFRYHASWVPMLAPDLAVLPTSIMSEAEFANTFFPVASQQLRAGTSLVGLPLMYDGLVLYYNVDMLQTAGVEPPTTWAELKLLASQLTVPSDRNQRASGTPIQRGGLAIGNASNIDHFSDILALLILQNGGNPGEPAFAEVRDALAFYTNFVTEDLVWSNALPSSTVAFARGDAAMMFAPSWRAHEITALNPGLNFATAPLPQLSENTIAWANYWAEGVNRHNGNQAHAWQFLKYLTEADTMRKLHSSQSQLRAFGEPYSRVDLASELQSDPVIGAVLQDAPIAQGWFMSSATHDAGLNDNIIGYYQTAVNAVIGGGDLDDILLALEQGVKQELRQYQGTQ